jgi:integrase
MTGRPKLEIGSHGDIWVRPNNKGGFQARAYVRDRDGRTRETTATGTTRGAAKRALEQRLKTRQRSSSTGMSSSMTVEEACTFWIEHRRKTGLLRTRAKIKPQTLGAYQGAIDLLIIPTMGSLQLPEATVGLLDAVLADLDDGGQSTAQARTVLSQVFALARRHEAIAYNPMPSVAPLRREPHEVEALNVEEAHHLRHLVDPNTRRQPGRRGPNRDLAEVTDALLGTGCRIGEILAVQWEHFDDNPTTPTFTISGTLIEPRKKYVAKLHRQDSTKSGTDRTLILPDALVETIRARRERSKYTGPQDPIFAAANGQWLWPSNIRTRLRAAILDHDLQGTTPHTLRRTVATLVARIEGLEAAREQLGHAQPGITAQLYVEPSTIAPDLRHILDAFF